MPYISIEFLKGRTLARRQEFAGRVVAAALECFASTPDRVRIVHREVDASELAGGLAVAMPLISVEILKGRTLDQRRDFVRRVAAAAAELLDTPAETMRVLFRELELTEVARGAVLAADAQARPAGS